MSTIFRAVPGIEKEKACPARGDGAAAEQTAAAFFTQSLFKSAPASGKFLLDIVFKQEGVDQFFNDRLLFVG